MSPLPRSGTVRSLSARRAWIEICWGTAVIAFLSGVALRKESVDRNRQALTHCEEQVESLSARRAWIEIVSFRGHGFWPRVALRKESVDRNIGVGTTRDRRGVSLSARRAWIEIVNDAKLDDNIRSRSPQGERG